ncbi:hypothetical protein AT6N2_C1219 [Agrobacterium tumefaciens]|uniref:Lipoprotein n=1 Tax=Agrobacterium tumefaciens TaxID=358 RepID=A0A176WZS7_AGRTU|nr:hypothetical protein [Agrobacterium tumefaciens]OAE38462.1 hypothetical protein A7J57_18545 [Agrobacterium tumefaciens]QTK78999.1 hypothetical protein AT6N2_C1219 [Agrobacterium tumefaciens]
MKIALPLLAIVALLSLTGCQRDEPREVAKLSGRMFVFNYRVAVATYLVTLQRIAPIRDGSTVEAAFENPRGGPDLIINDKIFPTDDRITVQSPPVECVKQDRPYKVSIRIKAPEGDILQTIQTTIRSDTDQSVLPAKPLVVGPLYTPNPEVFKADGSTDMRPVQGCPAS